MENRTVMTIALDANNGQYNILFGDGIEAKDNAKQGDVFRVRMGGGMSIRTALMMFLTTMKTLKEKAMENPQLKEEDRLPLEQEIYDVVNISVGAFLDQSFPLVNASASLTEEACVEYGLDPKTATAEELLAAENRFIDEHPERAMKTAEMILEKPKQYDGSVGGPNRETRRKHKKH